MVSKAWRQLNLKNEGERETLINGLAILLMRTDYDSLDYNILRLLILRLGRIKFDIKPSKSPVPTLANQL